MSMYACELDMAIASDEDEQKLAEELTDAGLTHAIVTNNGPGGGNPVYRIRGPLEPLTAYLRTYADGDDLEYARLLVEDTQRDD